MRFAFEDDRVGFVRAHTKPENNSLVRVLEKCGFRRVGEVVDPEDGFVWRWERSIGTAMQNVHGILEAALYVEDLGRSVRFYQDLFDFEQEIRADLICVLRVPGRQALILFPKRIASEVTGPITPVGAVEGTIPPHGGNGRLHVAFSIDASKLEWWEQRLADRGIALEGKVRWKRGGVSLYFRDPDEHLVELITPGLWSFY